MHEYVPLLFPSSRSLSAEYGDDIEDVELALAPLVVAKQEAQDMLRLTQSDTSREGALLTQALRNYLHPRAALCLPSDARKMTLKYGARCASCATYLKAPMLCTYSRMLKRVWCMKCAEG